MNEEPKPIETRHPDCAAIGGSTISRRKGCINDEQLECVRCHHSVVWDLAESCFFGFEANCGEKPDPTPTKP